jgi:ribonuclease D
VFDTQIAAMALGHGDSIAYDALVQTVLKRKVDKTSRFTDWSRRPLSDQQLAYALADATHLRDIYPKLHGQLEQRGRLEWIADELAALVNPAIYDLEPENAWSRLKLRKTQPEYLAALRAAAAWRERTAQARNVPRARVLKDDALYEIAEQKPRRTEQFDRLRAVPKGFGGSRHAQELADALDAALDNAESYAPQVERTPGGAAGGPTVELLRVLLRVVAEDWEVAPRLLAHAADLDAIAGSDEAETAALQGWRREVFGERALALKHGRIGMTLKRGKVQIVEC